MEKFPRTRDSQKNTMDKFLEREILKKTLWTSFHVLKNRGLRSRHQDEPIGPCGDGSIDVKENKIRGYKTVEINGF